MNEQTAFIGVLLFRDYSLTPWSSCPASVYICLLYISSIALTSFLLFSILHLHLATLYFIACFNIVHSRQHFPFPFFF
jgi:hypothetical protein